MIAIENLERSTYKARPFLEGHQVMPSLSQNRRDKQTQGRRKGKGCKTKKQDLFQFLKDTMKTNPREARSDYCALS